MEEVVQGPARDSLKLGTPAPGLRDALEEAPTLERSTSSLSASAAPQAAESKEQMIVQFKKQTESVLAQVRDATGNFNQIDRIDKVTAFPAAVSASIGSLAERSRDFRAKLGYAAAFYECGAETATVDALVAVDEATRDWSQKNAPVGRSKLVNFFMRYPSPTRDNQKPLWRYNGSMLIAFNDVKKKAEDHLQRAKSFEAAGKKSEALREYKEINRIYPNTITEDKIKQLESSPR